MKPSTGGGAKLGSCIRLPSGPGTKGAPGPAKAPAPNSLPPTGGKAPGSKKSAGGEVKKSAGGGPKFATTPGSGRESGEKLPTPGMLIIPNSSAKAPGKSSIVGEIPAGGGPKSGAKGGGGANSPPAESNTGAPGIPG